MTHMFLFTSLSIAIFILICVQVRSSASRSTTSLNKRDPIAIFIEFVCAMNMELKNPLDRPSDGFIFIFSCGEQSFRTSSRSLLDCSSPVYHEEFMFAVTQRDCSAVLPDVLISCVQVLAGQEVKVGSGILELLDFLWTHEIHSRLEIVGTERMMDHLTTCELLNESGDSVGRTLVGVRVCLSAPPHRLER
jgi:hypothetical protein